MVGVAFERGTTANPNDRMLTYFVLAFNHTSYALTMPFISRIKVSCKMRVDGATF